MINITNASNNKCFRNLKKHILYTKLVGLD